MASAEATYPIIAPVPGRTEVDPKALWHAFTQVVRSISAQTTHDPVQALAISSHGETFIPIGPDGNPLGAGIMNSDNRATAEAVWWERQVGRGHIHTITGAVPHPMYPLAKIHWLHTHEPERWSAVTRFASISDFFLQRLGLPPYIDYSLASRYMAFDLRTKAWSQEILQIASLKPQQFPIPVPAGTLAGCLNASIAAELGLDPGVQVAVGGHDQPCCALGVGATSPGQVAVSIGTYECLTRVGDAPAVGEKALAASLNSCCHVVPDTYITLAFFPSGVMLQWLVDTLGAGDYATLERTMSAGPTGVLITPHVIGSCNPHWDARARGAIYGIVPTTTSADLYKAALEGIACEYALNARALAECTGPFTAVYVAGGGTRSLFGLRLRASLTDMIIHISASQEATCLGAALLAGQAVGMYSGPEEAVHTAVRPGDTIKTDEELVAAYRHQFERYCTLYSALAPLRQTENLKGEIPSASGPLKE